MYTVINSKTIIEINLEYFSNLVLVYLPKLNPRNVNILLNDIKISEARHMLFVIYSKPRPNVKASIDTSSENESIVVSLNSWYSFSSLNDLIISIKISISIIVSINFSFMSIYLSSLVLMSKPISGIKK